MLPSFSSHKSSTLLSPFQLSFWVWPHQPPVTDNFFRVSTNEWLSVLQKTIGGVGRLKIFLTRDGTRKPALAASSRESFRNWQALCHSHQSLWLTTYWHKLIIASFYKDYVLYVMSQRLLMWNLYKQSLVVTQSFTLYDFNLESVLLALIL